VKKGQKADPFLVAGWKHRSLWVINHATGESARTDIISDDDWLRTEAGTDSKDFSVDRHAHERRNARHTTPMRFSTASPESATKQPKPAFSVHAAKTSAR
jgi:hypothetical protein